MLARRIMQIPRLLRSRPVRLGTAAAHARPLASPTLCHGGRSVFSVASAFFGEQSDPDPMRVVVLAGFLGAGKTTVLEQLLREQHGYRLGVIVNDLASVNVDANVLRDSINAAGAQSISLENGCVCCTAADDLRESVRRLIDGAESNGLDAVVVELSGVAEPARVKNLFEQPPEAGWLKQAAPPLSVRTVTVVDIPAFATDYMSEQSQHSHDHSATGECDNRYGTLLAEQVETADLVLLNKADVATEQELLQTRRMVGALNEVAETHVTRHGKVGVQRLLAIKPRKGRDTAESRKVQEAAPSLPSCCAAKTCSSTNPDSAEACGSANPGSTVTYNDEMKTRAETRFGITSFVYTTESMMSRSKLVRELSKWHRARLACGDKLSLEGLGADAAPNSTCEEETDSPLSPILRSKGIMLLDANPEVAFYLSYAGKSVSMSMLGPWPEAKPQAEGGFGARRTELVFIGSRYDEEAIRKVLDSCRAE